MDQFRIHMDQFRIIYTQVIISIFILLLCLQMAKLHNVHFQYISPKLFPMPFNLTLNHFKVKVCIALGLDDITLKLYYCQHWYN